MEIKDAKVLVAGATGALGHKLVHALVAEGARVVPAGRDAERLKELAGVCGTVPQTFEAADGGSVRAAVDGAADELDGLDLLVVTVGAAGFGDALATDPAITQELFTTNTFGPIALVRAAAPRLSEGGKVVVLSAILADLPTNDMADYSAAKSALSAWLAVVRREQRRAFGVLDVRPPHLDTGLEQRAIAGDAPKLPGSYPSDDVVSAIVRGIQDDAKELVWDPKEKQLQQQ